MNTPKEGGRPVLPISVDLAITHAAGTIQELAVVDGLRQRTPSEAVEELILAVNEHLDEATWAGPTIMQLESAAQALRALEDHAGLGRPDGTLPPPVEGGGAQRRVVAPETAAGSGLPTARPKPAARPVV